MGYFGKRTSTTKMCSRLSFAISCNGRAGNAVEETAFTAILGSICEDTSPPEASRKASTSRNDGAINADGDTWGGASVRLALMKHENLLPCPASEATL